MQKKKKDTLHSIIKQEKTRNGLIQLGRANNKIPIRYRIVVTISDTKCAIDYTNKVRALKAYEEFKEKML